MHRAETSNTLRWSTLLVAILGLSASLIVGCGDDDRPPPGVGGTGAMDGGGSGGVGADADGGGGIGADGGGGFGADGGGGFGGAAGTMDASFDGGAGVAGGDTDGGSEDAGPQGPPGWLCRGSLFNDGFCDCGCGVLDGDCIAGCAEPGCTDTTCEACFAASGAWVPCVTATWTCDAAELDDANNFCDCGCGAPDPDCLGRGCTNASCRAQACDRCHDDTNAVIGCQTPIEWQCDRGAYGGGDGCDCGCGAIDPDCDTGGCADSNCTDPACDVCRNGGGTVVRCGLPLDWLCSPLSYDSDDGCDCGCGAIDPDCDGAGCVDDACSDVSCDVCHYGTLVGACTIPPAWTCHPVFYEHNGVCDCGCGAADPDCGSAGCTGAGCQANGCELCHDTGDAIAACTTWTCDVSQRGSGDGCDCGCGATDPDCLILPSCTGSGCNVDTCEQCNAGSVRTECGGWTCGLERYGDGHCDCGCGAADPDCDGGGCAEPGCVAPACEQCSDANGRKVACETGSCPVSVISAGDGCDCGCGVVDPDCTGLSACTQPGCSASECARCYDPRGRVINCL